MPRWKIRNPDSYNTCYLFAIRQCFQRMLDGEMSTECLIDIPEGRSLLVNKSKVTIERNRFANLRMCLKHYPLHPLHGALQYHWRLRTIYSEGGGFPVRFILRMENRMGIIEDLVDSLRENG